MGNWPYPCIVAYRGGGKLTPENILASIDIGAKYGHKVIEFDTELSKDGEIFPLHDDNPGRTSNGQDVADELNWQDLLRVGASSWCSKMFKGESLLLFSQVAERCREHGMMANIEIRPTTGTGPLTDKVVVLAVRELWVGMMLLLLSSFEIDTLEAAQQAAPELPCGLLLDEWCDDWRELTARLGCVSIHPNHKLLNKAQVIQLKDAGLRILVYTVNKPQRAAELLRWGVDCICIDVIDVIGLNSTTQQFSMGCQAAAYWADLAYYRFSSPVAYATGSMSYPDYGCCSASRCWCWVALAAGWDFAPPAVTATPAENCCLPGFLNAAVATEFALSVADSAPLFVGFAEPAPESTSAAGWVSDTPAS